MNYREFNERVYNYKHGIKTVADDQSNSIEHGIIGEGGDHIAHYELGQEADNHKYKEKIYLGEGKYRYIYDDGTSSTGYKPLDANDPVRQNQRAKIEGQQNTKQQAEGIGKFLSSNVGRTGEDIAWQSIQGTLKGENERKENSQITPATKATWERIEGQNATKDQAQGIGNFLKSNIQESYSSTSPVREYGKITTDNGNTVLASKDYIDAMRNQGGEVIEEAKDKSPNNPDFANARKDSYDAENRDKAIPTSRPIKWKGVDERSEFGKGKADEMAAQYGGTGGETKPNTGALGTKVAPDSMKSTSAPNYASGLASNLAPTALPDAAKNSDLGSTASGIADALNNKKEGRVKGAPYSQLNAQSVAATNNPANTAQNIADSYMNEISHLKDFATRAGMSEEEFWKIIDSYETVYGGDVVASSLNGVDRNNINWMEGADTSMQNYMSNVLPKIQEGIADRMNRMTPPVKDAVPNENAVPAQQSPYERYIKERGYNPYNIKGSDLKALFPSMYNENFNDNEYYGLNDSDQTFIPVSSVDPNKWYNSETDEFVSGNTSSEDNDFYKAFRSSFYNATLNKLRNNSSYSDLFTDQELQDLAMQMTNSYVENMKNASNK